MIDGDDGIRSGRNAAIMPAGCAITHPYEVRL
jgi:hypothetical protein